MWCLRSCAGVVVVVAVVVVAFVACGLLFCFVGQTSVPSLVVLLASEANVRAVTCRFVLSFC